MRALVVHPGTQHSHRLAMELHRLNALSGLHTGFAVASGGTLAQIYKLAPDSLRRRVANRRIEHLPPRLVSLQPLLECVAMAGIRGGNDDQGILHWRNERFQRSIPSCALEEADVVVGFDTSSWILVDRCREARKPLIMVQTIGHPDSKKVSLDEVSLRFPDWFAASKPRLASVRQAERAEHDGATLIVASSSFTRQTLVDNGVQQSKICIIPHGVDCRRFSASRRTGGRPFRFVFVGLIDARKGIPLLMEAWRQLKPQNAELWLVGPGSRHIKSLLPALPGLRYVGAVPQTELPRILSECDVFVFPSYFEGFGLVLLQAMACGLPVITTSATAGPDLLRAGDAGWVVPPGDTDKLARAMSYCLSHPSEMPRFGRAARSIAEAHSWQIYGQRWLPVLEEAKLLTSRRFAATADTQHGHSGSPYGNGTLERVLLVHPGTQYSGQLARLLEQHHMLSEFHTAFAVAGDGLLSGAVKALPKSWQRKLANRSIQGVPQARLHTRPWLELRALAALVSGENEEKVFYRRNAAFQHNVPDKAIDAAAATIGFDTSSWIIAQRVRDRGRLFLLDQSIGHPRSFANAAARLRQQFPDWTAIPTFKTENDFEREAREHELASRIVAPSRFVARTLEDNGVDGSKIRINPFGVNLDLFQPAAVPPPLKPLRFAFVGSLQTRKGIPLLLEAWNRLPPGHGAELCLVGGGEIPAAVRSSLPQSVRFFGRLAQSEMAKILQLCHVFVFPSYFEGLAQVQIEAAACGLPVIGTDSSGCEEIVRDEETGYILPTGDLDALRSTLLKLISTPELVLKMREQLIVERHKWSWTAYGQRWMTILREIVAA